MFQNIEKKKTKNHLDKDWLYMRFMRSNSYDYSYRIFQKVDDFYFTIEGFATTTRCVHFTDYSGQAKKNSLSSRPLLAENNLF